MKKVKITEEQFYRYMIKEETTELPDSSDIDTDLVQVQENQSKLPVAPSEELMEDNEFEALMENVEKTQGGIQIRNLIKESTFIKGEYKSPYGQWHTSVWNVDGTPINSTSEYNKYIFTIDLDK